MPLDPISAAYTTADNQKQENPGEQNGRLLKGKTSNYNILEIISKGTFGKVAKGMNLSTKKEGAIKILETEKTQITGKEIDMMEVRSILDPVKTNMVHFHEKLQQGQHTYLVFEKLDMNLEQLLKNRKYIPLSVTEIWPIAQQLLTALEAMRGPGLIHTNLKPDNIMLVYHKDQPFRVKLIDFCMALRTSKVRRGMVMQSLGYRAPEVSLGLPISGAVDLWGLGCILTYLYLSKELFGMGCEYQMMRSMVNVLGKPDDKLLNAEKYTYPFFKKNKPWGKWSLKCPWEYMQGTDIKSKNMWQTVSSLNELDTIYPEIQDLIEKMDRRAFINLLKLLLHIDPALRITSAAALQHPLVSMSHMEQELDTSLYVNDTFKMIVCKMDNSKEDSILNEKVPASLLCNDGITKAPASPGEVLLVKMEDSQVETSDNEAEEEVQVVSTTSPCSCEGSTNLPEGAVAEAEGAGAFSPNAVSRDPTEETTVPDGSPDVR